MTNEYVNDESHFNKVYFLFGIGTIVISWSMNLFYFSETTECKKFSGLIYLQ